MFNNLWLYLPLVALFALDFALFGHKDNAQPEPDLLFQCDNDFARELAAMRENAGYGHG